MDVITPSTWESKHVAAWLSSIGFSNLEKKIIENGITGQILVHADHELLKELNVQSVGKRLKILNSIYGMKIKYNVPIEDYDYIPKSVKMEMEKDMIYNETKYKIIDNKYKENEQSVNRLTNDVKKINEDMKQFKEDIKIIKTLMNNNMPKELGKVKSNSNTNLFALAEQDNSQKTSETIKVYSALEKKECETLYKSLKITMEDTTSVFLAEVLKKYQIKNDIALYRLSINSVRYLENNEHPLEVLQNFKSRGITANLFLRKINLKDEQKAKINSMEMSSMPLNIIKNDTDKAYVLLPYKKKKDNEVSAELGEMIEILDRESVEKYRVQKKGGIIGYLPTECFVELEPGDVMELYDFPIESEIKKDYKKVNAYEVSLKKGDKVKVCAKFRTWMYVDSNKKQGWMPINNIELNPDNPSLDDISKSDESRPRLHNEFGSTSSLFNNNIRGNNSSSHLNEFNDNLRNHSLESINEKEMLVNHTTEIKRLTRGPISNSVDNIYTTPTPTSPKRSGLNNNVTGIKTNMHARCSSSTDSPSTNSQMIYNKVHLPSHSRNNSCDHFTSIEKDKEPASAHTPNYIYGTLPRDNDSERSLNGKNAFTKLNDLLYNFSPYENEGKQSPVLYKNNPKLH